MQVQVPQITAETFHAEGPNARKIDQLAKELGQLARAVEQLALIVEAMR